MIFQFGHTGIKFVEWFPYVFYCLIRSCTLEPARIQNSVHFTYLYISEKFIIKVQVVSFIFILFAMHSEKTVSVHLIFRLFSIQGIQYYVEKFRKWRIQQMNEKNWTSYIWSISQCNNKCKNYNFEKSRNSIINWII